MDLGLHVSSELKKNQWVPNADVCVTSEGLVVKVELAGINQEDVEVVLDGARLVIRGERRDWCRGACKFIVSEIQNGAFECVIDFPPGFDLARATARYNNGFLRIEVPDATVG